ALERAQEIVDGVLGRAERRRRHLALLCEAEVARRNDAEGERGQREARRRTLLLRHHQEALRQHAGHARAFARLYGGAMPPTAPAAGDAPPPARGRAADLPPERDPTYAPAFCAGAPAEQGYEVRVGARVVRRASALLRGLQYLRLADDLVFRPLRKP
ncbi:MAG TPA: hypothetical protein VFX98_15655, partial [Longimicrobiaceae bacterium]|nr:hypothetical protein [Longimicrobiaceae bacterium]